MRGAYTHEIRAKNPEADQPPPGTEAPKISRRRQNNLYNRPQHRSIQVTIPTVTVSFKPYTYIPNRIDQHPLTQKTSLNETT